MLHKSKIRKMSKGFLKLPREAFDHWTRGDLTKWGAFVDLIGMAAWKPRQQLINGKLLDINCGEIPATISFLSKRWKWSTQTTRTFISQLEASGDINKRVTRGITIIYLDSIWSEGQSVTSEQQEEQQTDNKRVTNEQQTRNNNIRTKDLKEAKELKKKKAKGITDADVSVIWDCYSNKKDGQIGKDAIKKALGLKGVTVNMLKEAIAQYDRHLAANPWKKKMNAQGWFNQKKWTAEFSEEDFVNHDTQSNKPGTMSSEERLSWSLPDDTQQSI